MKIGIIGSRKRKDRQTIVDFINSLPQDWIIVSGGCKGVDSWAETAALKRGMKTEIFYPDLKKARAEGGEKWRISQAYYERNKKIAQFADKIVAFVSEDRKGGTENTIQYAIKYGKQIEIK